MWRKIKNLFHVIIIMIHHLHYHRWFRSFMMMKMEEMEEKKMMFINSERSIKGTIIVIITVMVVITVHIILLKLSSSPFSITCIPCPDLIALLPAFKRKGNSFLVCESGISIFPVNLQIIELLLILSHSLILPFIIMTVNITVKGWREIFQSLVTISSSFIENQHIYTLYIYPWAKRSEKVICSGFV